MHKLRIVYFGAPDFSAWFLEKMIEDTTLPVEVVAVVTQPDKKVGRKQIVTPTPVKIVAEKYRIPIYYDHGVGVGLDRPDNRTGQDLSLAESKVKGRKSIIENIDLALVYAYGKILPESILNLPKYGFWNIHPSLLPKYRGTSPMAHALLMGEATTGVTLMKMTEKWDQGPIMAQEEMNINPDDRRPDLERKLTDLGFELFKKIIASCRDNPRVVPTCEIVPTREQNHHAATYTKLLHKNDGFVPFETVRKLVKGDEIIPAYFPNILTEYWVKYALPLPHPSPAIFYNLFRALYPWPGIWTYVSIKGEQKRLKITDASFRNNRFSILKVQLEGKNEVDFETFERSFPLFS